ncbi:hypothetical protein BZG36_01099 [Bifiguratus adelaidae]|uniref:Metallo-beta-lactamase domain-containing protein n=1 Tax=Bifiguratus adelaidae TaxID=1938954 RepID=A0A261Y689_9FUNG|nr:hypothetical protein BZG36_01099 [Bifiguratus adelaidae]
MPHYICVTCGVQFAATTTPPSECKICNDPRQYIGLSGQQWTTLEELQQSGKYKNTFTPDERDDRIIAIRTEPQFAIGQRAAIIKTSKGLIMWDCITYIDQETIDYINRMGTLMAIIISHPHFYDCCVEWSKAFQDIPIYISNFDREWVVRPDSRIKLWKGTDLDLLDGEVHVVAAGGHFDGSCILIWKRDRFPPIAFTADTIMVVMDRNFVSFMWSYPNMIPLKPASLIELWNRVRPHQFDELWGGFPSANLREGARAKVFKSARRYLEQEDHVLLAQQLQE